MSWQKTQLFTAPLTQVLIPFQSVQLFKVTPGAKNKMVGALTNQTMNADEQGGSPAAY